MAFWNRNKEPKFSLDRSAEQLQHLGGKYERWIELFNRQRSGENLSSDEMAELGMLTGVADDGEKSDFFEEFKKYRDKK